ncbi:uncharacterized protein A1O9_05658 [Exophiala aquamarina CBS 119918]|uniref:Uncharacterized protein n=1 Tax=Exophiala aquamarina CBS 119918 TaxID=1182545 RepID=A0A072PEN0_9EURO|nr:uncharacterized protein A1O9_05658 [Exophiala aquamarina CBS 119918]KEF57738.1 hypothetical protein A1O9_05658 [Exophiala aquamarina CBS 119918]
MTGISTLLRKPGAVAASALLVATCIISLFLIRMNMEFDPTQSPRVSVEQVIPDDSIAQRPSPTVALASDTTSSSSPATPTADHQDDRPAESVVNATVAKHHDDDAVFDPGNGFRQIYSLSTSNGTFYPVSFGNESAYNVNVLPHPTRPDQWVIIAQALAQATVNGTVQLREVNCIAEFLHGVLACTEPATALRTAPSIPCVNCIDGESPPLLKMVFGPRDARMFYGPKHAYVMYGSQSHYTWLGLWIQHAGKLIPALNQADSDEASAFPEATEIERPTPHKLGYEKNFFLFWDSQGAMYVHHDIYPNRTFAQLSTNGSVHADLSPESASKDSICMAKHMPRPGPELEGIHQATNSLALTLCRRHDQDCHPSDENTFIMNIFQHKTYHSYHALYYSYVMLFQQTAPFAVHAISKKPLWIHGRDMLTNKTHAAYYDEHPPSMPKNHTEMFYITSISWKSSKQKYNGYIDDPMFVSFGIEDTKSGTIDVSAGDLLQDLAYCEED